LEQLRDEAQQQKEAAPTKSQFDDGDVIDVDCETVKPKQIGKGES